VPSLFRVFPYLPKAPNDEPGGALYIPPQGGGRLDNPGIYSVLYVSDSASGAIAEAFGRFPEWTSAILEGSPSLPGSVRALVRFELPYNLPVCNLDDCAQLGELELRPSDVVTRDYARSRAWARGIYDQHRWIGVRWWSYYDPQWANFGLWNVEKLLLRDVSRIRLDDAALQEAAGILARRVMISASRSSRL
jgi:hypothetical protein